MTQQLPSIIRPGALTPLPDGKLIPTRIADAGENAAWRYVDFFTANIRNPNMRRDTAADPFGARREAAARRGAHAV